MKVKFNEFREEYLNKEATLLTLGNGYLGLRGVHEEYYRNQDKGLFIRGIYNKPYNSEVDEIVNLPDFSNNNIRVDGELVTLNPFNHTNFTRELDLNTGLLRRSFIWTSTTGNRIRFEFNRVVGQKNKHGIGFKICIKPELPCCVSIESSIDATITNKGNQHVVEKELRSFEDQILYGKYETINSERKIDIFLKLNLTGQVTSKNRILKHKTEFHLEENQKFVYEKVALVHTDLDQEYPSNIADIYDLDFDTLYIDSVDYWNDFWTNNRIIIDSENNFDQKIMDFAIYHLQIMTPLEAGYSVGAKGLTGEGYKGHIFWDTEIFILPFFLHSQPHIARNLLKYRFLKIDGAKEKAKLNGYKGAQFPWESAYTGYEETPKYSTINIKTGERQIISSGAAEHHIVADIAFAINDYFQSTKDNHFMNRYGKEMLEQTADFWLSRVTRDKGYLEIKNVIGPDEYTEHIDNNAYTNYMAYYNVKYALEMCDLSVEKTKQYRYFIKNIYLPQPNSQLLIPQDDSFLKKPVIDIQAYKKNAGEQLILLDYSRQEVIDLQVLKQADLVMLFYLHPHLFDDNIQLLNLDYYEDKTIHDSSLSKAIHAIVAARLQKNEWAYNLFQDAAKIDLNDQPHSCDDGIHAASLGAVWMTVIFGFAGIKKKEMLEIKPNLPENWRKISFHFFWRDELLFITITKESITIEKKTSSLIQIIVEGETYNLVDVLTLKRKNR